MICTGCSRMPIGWDAGDRAFEARERDRADVQRLRDDIASARQKMEELKRPWPRFPTYPDDLLLLFRTKSAFELNAIGALEKANEIDVAHKEAGRAYVEERDRADWRLTDLLREEHRAVDAFVKRWGSPP